MHWLCLGSCFLTASSFATGSWWLIFFWIWNLEFAYLHLWRLPFDSRDQFIQRGFQRRCELHRRVEAWQGKTALDLADRRAMRRGPEGELVLAHVRCVASLGEVDSEAAGELLAFQAYAPTHGYTPPLQ
jgi:hypothetical protein